MKLSPIVMISVRPPSFDNVLTKGPDNGFTPGSRLSNMTPLEKKIRQSSGRNSFAIRGRQERSPSVLGEKNLDPKQLVSDEDANDFNRTSASCGDADNSRR